MVSAVAASEAPTDTSDLTVTVCKHVKTADDQQQYFVCAAETLIQTKTRGRRLMPKKEIKVQLCPHVSAETELLESTTLGGVFKRLLVTKNSVRLCINGRKTGKQSQRDGFPSSHFFKQTKTGPTCPKCQTNPLQQKWGELKTPSSF